MSLEFSAGNRGDAASQNMRALLESRFRPRTTEIHVTAYDHPWEDIMRALLDGMGPDVSEVGSTRARSLAGGNLVLRQDELDGRARGKCPDFVAAYPSKPG